MKIGIGYITCDAKDRINSTFKTIPKDLGEVVVVNSGSFFKESTFEGATNIIQLPRKASVSISKNRALRYLMSKNCDHLFLIEDDIEVLDASVFEKYIQTACDSGVYHLNYALQGGINRIQDKDADPKTVKEFLQLDMESKPAPRCKLPYKNRSKLAFYENLQGCFQYFYKGIVKNVGYFDERFVNYLENLDYVYRLVELGLHPPMKWFADIDGSEKYLSSLSDCMINSTLRNDVDYSKNVGTSRAWFKDKHSIYPEMIQDSMESKVLDVLNTISFNYSKELL